MIFLHHWHLFRTRISTQGTKLMISQWIVFLQLEGLRLKLSWRSWTSFFWKKVRCNIREIWYCFIFLAFPQCGDPTTTCFSRNISEVNLYFLTLGKLGDKEKLLPKSREESLNIFIQSRTFQQIWKLFRPFRKIKKFPIFEKLLRNTDLFQLHRTIDSFWE